MKSVETHTVGFDDLKISVKTRKIKKDGKPGHASRFEIDSLNVNLINDPVDRQIISMLLGANEYYYQATHRWC